LASIFGTDVTVWPGIEEASYCSAGAPTSVGVSIATRLFASWHLEQKVCVCYQLESKRGHS